jgi:ATP-dependent RNA helicase RhlE
MLFEDLSLSKSIQKAVFELGYTQATPIQEQAIPIVLSGKDIIGCAQTGTGKTAAFAIPIIHQLHRIVGSSKKAKQIRALVVTPTRELAVQIGQNFDAYSKYTNINQLTLFGGVGEGRLGNGCTSVFSAICFHSDISRLTAFTKSEKIVLLIHLSFWII